jgi:hypothetical protein
MNTESRKGGEMIEVFKTDVYYQWQADHLTGLLYQHFPDCKINFDLDDCDKILRIEGENFTGEKVKMIVNENGYLCEILE